MRLPIHYWIPLFVIAALGLWAFPLVQISRAEIDSKAESDEGHESDAPEDSEKPPVSISRDAEGRPVLTIETEAAERMGLKCGPIVAGHLNPSVTAYGRLEADPSMSFTVRSPVAGFLRCAPDTSWPMPGAILSEGGTICLIEPRLTPVDRYDLTTKLAQAHAEVDEVSADLLAANSSYESKKRLNESQKVVAERALEEARAKVMSGEARLIAAKQTVRLLEDAMHLGKDFTGGIPISLSRAGVAVEVLAQPGEAVESGEPILKTVDFSRLVARVALPPGTIPSGMPKAARIEIVGSATHVLSGKVLAALPADSTVTGLAFLVSMTNEEAVVRPGLAVIAHLELPGEPMSGIIIPRESVVRYGGSAFVFVRTADGQYTREPIDFDQPVEAGWFATSGPQVGAEVVVTGAGTLLSEELRGQIEAEAEGEE